MQHPRRKTASIWQLWKPDTPRHQKWLIGGVLGSLLGGTAPLLWMRSFVPAPAVQVAAFYTAALLLAGIGLWLRHLYRRGQWKPEGPWQDYGPVRRALMLPLVVAFFGFIFWMCMAMTLPAALHRITSHAEPQSATVSPHRNTGRHGCRYQLKIQHISFLFFEFCISQSDYQSLPDRPLPALLQVERSFWGQRITSLKLATPSFDGAPTSRYPDDHAGAMDAVDAVEEASETEATAATQ